MYTNTGKADVITWVWELPVQSIPTPLVLRDSVLYRHAACSWIKVGDDAHAGLYAEMAYGQSRRRANFVAVASDSRSDLDSISKPLEEVVLHLLAQKMDGFEGSVWIFDGSRLVKNFRKGIGRNKTQRNMWRKMTKRYDLDGILISAFSKMIGEVNVSPPLLLPPGRRACGYLDEQDSVYPSDKVDDTKQYQGIRLRPYGPSHLTFSPRATR